MRIEGVIFDFGRTLYDPTTRALFPKSIDTLDTLSSRGLRLGLASIAETDDTERRVQELTDLGIGQFFQAMDIIARSAREKDFTNVLAGLGMENEPQNCAAVGDNLKKEIEAGNRMGMFTIQTRQRLLFDAKPKNKFQIPKATVDVIEEIIPVIDRINIE